VTPQVYYNLGFTYEKLKQLPLALQAYESAVKLKPKNVNALTKVAYIHTQLGSLDGAVRSLQVMPPYLQWRFIAAYSREGRKGGGGGGGGGGVGRFCPTGAPGV
jgi:tetratricopeptide (TPR) repeat protein